VEQRVRLTQRLGTTQAARRVGWLLLAPALAFLAVFYLVPLGIMVEESLRSWSGDPDPSGGLTAYQYQRVWEQRRPWRALERTLRISLLSTVLTLLASFPVALYLLRCGPRARAAILLAVFVSLASSLIVRNYGWLVTLADAGPVNRLLLALGLADEPLRLVYSEGATVVALVHYAMPFMILPIYGALLRLPPSVIEASRSLGASPWRAFGGVVLPLSAPGVFGGTTLTFAICMSAFVTPLMLGSPATAMVSQIAAEQFLVQLNFPFGAALVVALTLVTFAVLLAYTLAMRALVRAP
jgi:putative spermidine/putrescine transport system permease protein